MLPNQDNTESLATGVHLVDAKEGLSQIQDPTCAAAIWQRGTLTDIQPLIDELSPENLPKANVIIPPEHLPKTVNEICGKAGIPDCLERKMLVEDIVMLADVFVKLIPTPFLRLRLDVVTTNACRKFHIDYLKARLVCTYRGTGTQYGNSTDGADPLHISTVPTGAPILLRGKHWPNTPDPCLLHRSPPIEGTGETRLVLVLDAAEKMYDEEELL